MFRSFISSIDIHPGRSSISCVAYSDTPFGCSLKQYMCRKPSEYLLCHTPNQMISLHSTPAKVVSRFVQGILI